MIVYNPKYYDKKVQANALNWWSTLSINEQKAFETKHGTIYGRVMNSEVAAIYDAEFPLTT